MSVVGYITSNQLKREVTELDHKDIDYNLKMKRLNMSLYVVDVLTN